jgi:hypothetical protein
MTGAPFLTTKLTGYRVAVEVAWGADLTDLTGAGWTWTDITTDVVLRDGEQIVIGLGRPDFSSETQTAEMRCMLDNRSGAYSEGGLSPNWPNIRRGTPVRVRVSTDNGATWNLRFQGNANGFTPRWDEATGRWATVELSASGPLRKLNQGTLPAKSVYATEIPKSSGWSSLIVYWPAEGGDDIHDNPTLIPASGRPALVLDPAYAPKVVNNPSNSAFPLSGPYQSAFKMATDDPMPSYTSTGILQVRMMVAIPGAFPVPQWQPLFYMTTTNSTVPTWSLQINETGDLRLIGQNGSGTTVRTGDTVGFNMNGAARLISVIFDNNGSALDTTITTLDPLGVAGFYDQSFTSTNIGTLTDMDVIGPDFSKDGTGTSNGLVAHISVQNSATDITATATKSVWQGLPGETVTARLTRLCNNHGIALSVLDSAVAENASITGTMGPQYYDTLTTLIRECEMTGQGVLYDGLGVGLTYVTKKRREANANGPASLVLDASQAQLMEPFQPVDDDQGTINHCDVQKRNGAVATYIDSSGPLGANVIGDYSTSLAVNPNSDVDLIRYAQWAVGLGTQQGYRYPTISFALETNAGLIPGWLACTPQARVDVTNVAAVRRQHPDERIRLLLEGWHETIDAFTWRVTANTSSALPWNVVVLAAATGSTGDGICHLDTDGSQLNASAAAGATSISVKTNTGPRWVASTEDADSFPFDLDVGGCKVTVTAVTGTTSPQTFTLAAGLPRAFTGSTTVGAGTPVQVWRPPVFGL